MRGTSRLVKVNPNTVMRYARLAGGHARKLHDELVAVSPLTRELQFDEKRSFVYQKEARCEEGEKTCGDNWDHTAIDPGHRLLSGIVPGKRTRGQCQKVVDEAKKHTGGRTGLLITSDGHQPYEPSIEHAYAVEVRQPDGSTRKEMPKAVPPLHRIQHKDPTTSSQVPA